MSAAVTAEATEAPRRRKVTDRAKAERRLAWMLCAPAVIAMLLVTVYPIGYAVVLSLQDVDLRFPDEGGFVGLDNYGAVLSSDLWWQGLFNTTFITVVSVAIELVLGMIIALVMHRAIFGRGVVRTAVPDPVRDRHRRRRVRVVLRLRPDERLRQRPSVRRPTTRPGSATAGARWR